MFSIAVGAVVARAQEGGAFDLVDAGDEKGACMERPDRSRPALRAIRSPVSPKPAPAART